MLLPFAQFTKLPGRHKWRGIYAEENAFAICAAMRRPPWLHILQNWKSTTWRGTYARVNAFDKCEQLDKPKWLRFLPPNAKDKWREDFTEAVR